MFILHTSNLVQIAYDFHTCSKHSFFFFFFFFFFCRTYRNVIPYINGTAITGVIVLKTIRQSTEDLSIPSTNGTLFNGTCSVGHALKTSVHIRKFLTV
jgi:hypothetical protein